MVLSGLASRYRQCGPVLSVIVLGAGACSAAEEASVPIEATGPVVTVVEASIQTIRDVATAAGQVVPAAGTDWTIYAPEPAMIAEMPKALGDPVAAGDLLVRFEVGAHAQNFAVRQAAVSDATARADAARAELSRLTPLFERGIVPRNDVETARADFAAADAARLTAEAYLEEARLLRDAGRVTARFSGVVAELWHAPGEFTSGASTDPVLRVIDPSRAEIQVELPSPQALRVRDSHPAQVLTLTTGAFTALVTRRPAGLLMESATVPVRLTAPELSTLALNDVVQVEIVLDERPGALVVPIEAIQRDGTVTYVMVADQDSIARRRPVRLGLTSGGLVEITEGLTPGSLVIISGLADVADDQPVIVSR